MRRVFLGWDRPALPLVADRLLEPFASGAEADLGATVVALPGARAGRRLLELLVEQAERRSLRWTPPGIVTVGALADRLLPCPRRAASRSERRIAWERALAAEPAAVERLAPGRTPSDRDAAGRLAIARELERLHRELSGEDLTMEEVLLRAEKGLSLDPARWSALASLQSSYLEILEAAGLEDPDSTRQHGIRAGRARLEGPLWVVGATDLRALQRRLLDSLPGEVTILVLAPEELADAFDTHGCVRPDRWRDRRLDVPLERISVAARPSDQAELALRLLTRHRPRHPPDEMAIGVADPAVGPALERSLSDRGLLAHDAAGLDLDHTPVVRLLTAVRDVLRAPGAETLAALARHPDVSVGSVAALDRLLRDRLPARLASSDLPGPLGPRVRAILDPLGDRNGTRPASAWAPRILDLLREALGERELDRDRPADRRVLVAVDRVTAALRELARLPPSLDPPANAAAALDLLLDRLQGETIPRPSTPEPAVEILGWLELPLDDAPALVVTGLNEGRVPAATGVDPFLPDSVRTALGLSSEGSRYARDAHALSYLLASRPDARLVLGRQEADGDPLAPSRLLLAVADDEIPDRVDHLFSPGAEVRRRRPPPAADPFVIPHPDDLATPEEVEAALTPLNVTWFGEYLRCPYRFFLHRVLGLDELDDRQEELDPLAFGSLAHEVLDAFGRAGWTSTTREEAIAAFLVDDLQSRLRSRYGARPRPAIRIQAEILADRLRAFAAWQAQWLADGWTIGRVEERAEAELTVDGRAERIVGRIDRIDRLGSDGEHVVFDYKTSDKAADPEKAHRKRRQEWTDLQLPLYHHLARGLGIEGPIRLGYIALPASLGETGGRIADWDDDELAEADRAAEDVVRRIRRREFWPPASRIPEAWDPFAAICRMRAPPDRGAPAAAGEEGSR